MRAQRLTTIIFIGMLLGIAVGYACHELWPDPQTAKTIAGYISLFTDIFLRLIKMIIAPLVFTTLVVGVAHMGDTKSVGRIGGKAMLWFVSASLVSLLLGLIMVNVLRPGDSLNLPLPDATAATNLNALGPSAKTVASSRIDMLAGLSGLYIRNMPPCFWANAASAAAITVNNAPTAASTRSSRFMALPPCCLA
jgi:Na+/H+-dicarboxylate symporter